MLQLHFGSGQIDIRWRQVKAEPGFHHDAGKAKTVVHQHVVDGFVECIGGNAQADRTAALGIKIDHQNTLIPSAQTGGQIESGGRFGDATFLIGYGDDPGSRGCAVNSIVNRLSGDTIFTPDLGGGESAGFDPAHDGVLMHIEQPGGFFGGQKMRIIHKSMEPDSTFCYPERHLKY